MKEITQKLKEEYGAVQVIEMTLIFPFVILVLGFLIYTGSYVLQSVAIFNDAQRIAVMANRQSAIPGYELFYDMGGITTKADFNWPNDYTPQKALINAVMSEHDPYRYWTNSFLSSSEKQTLEAEVIKVVQRISFLYSSDVDCTIQTSNNGISQSIKVNIVKRLGTPGFLQSILSNGSMDINVTAVAVVGDNSDFIRNTDIVFDVGTYLWDDLKFGDNNQSMGERISIFKQKFTDAKAKFGW